MYVYIYIYIWVPIMGWMTPNHIPCFDPSTCEKMIYFTSSDPHHGILDFRQLFRFQVRNQTSLFAHLLLEFGR